MQQEKKYDYEVNGSKYSVYQVRDGEYEINKITEGKTEISGKAGIAIWYEGSDVWHFDGIEIPEADRPFIVRRIAERFPRL